MRGRGTVDLATFACTDTPRSTVVQRVCYDEARQPSAGECRRRLFGILPPAGRDLRCVHRRAIDGPVLPAAHCRGSGTPFRLRRRTHKLKRPQRCAAFDRKSQASDLPGAGAEEAGAGEAHRLTGGLGDLALLRPRSPRASSARRERTGQRSRARAPSAVISGAGAGPGSAACCGLGRLRNDRRLGGVEHDPLRPLLLGTDAHGRLVDVRPRAVDADIGHRLRREESQMQTAAPSRRRRRTENIEPEASSRSPLPTANRAGPTAKPAGMPVSSGSPGMVQPGAVTFSGLRAVLAAATRESGLNPACRDQRTFRLVGINVDKADMDPGEGLAALHVRRRRAITRLRSVRWLPSRRAKAQAISISLTA